MFAGIIAVLAAATFLDPCCYPCTYGRCGRPRRVCGCGCGCGRPGCRCHQHPHPHPHPQPRALGQQRPYPPRR